MSGSKVLFHLRSTRSWLENVSLGKLTGGDCLGQWSSPSVSPQLVTVATVRNNATVIIRKVGGVTVEIMLDTESAVSLLRHSEVLSMHTCQSSSRCSSIKLVTSSGEPLPIISFVEATVNITDQFATSHQFLIVDSLIYPIILGTEFLCKHHLCLDFTVTVQQSGCELDSVQPLWEATVETKAKRCITVAIATSDHDIVDECGVPSYNQRLTYDMPSCSDMTFGNVLQEYKHLFRSKPGATTVATTIRKSSKNPSTSNSWPLQARS